MLKFTLRRFDTVLLTEKMEMKLKLKLLEDSNSNPKPRAAYAGNEEAGRSDP